MGLAPLEIGQPVFECATEVEFSGAVPGATLQIFQVGGVTPLSGTGAALRLGMSLNAGDLVTLSQDLGACRGLEGTTVVVQP